MHVRVRVRVRGCAIKDLTDQNILLYVGGGQVKILVILSSRASVASKCTPRQPIKGPLVCIYGIYGHMFM